MRDTDGLFVFIHDVFPPSSLAYTSCNDDDDDDDTHIPLLPSRARLSPTPIHF